MIIISLFDFSGVWSKPWKDAGYEVIQVDIKLGIDILTWNYKAINKKDVYFILVAIPCTDYALSGAKHFKRKDADGTTAKSQLLVTKTKEIIDYFECNYVIENPMSRIHKLNPWMGEVKFKFHPYYFGNGIQKMTWLWGNFNNPVLNPGQNMGNKYYTNLGGKSERTKELRSNTDINFSKAFFEANKIKHNYK
jgi:hypothetical protein